ncbi:MAG TPA: Amuc_1100 family pilus-like protein [Verrucomicrobiae bacterium]|jgi:hypothetical protein|nr:Amuc_1100 family pilus-like protein [Verrucomicrobiae bacterium]
MGWIKRNLFFAIGGVIALLLLGAAAFYDYQGWSHNSTAKDKLNEIYGKLTELTGEKPSPGNARIDNIKTAREQEREVSEWVDGTGNYFKPIMPIPNSPEVSSEAFAAALRRTIDQLQHEADAASVRLPPKYSFSFEAQRSIVKFAPGSLPLLSVQLGEVKTISEILFAAHVNSLDNIQRVRVSDDDTAGPQADYLNDVSVANSLVVLTPYAVTFRSFSGELAAVLADFAASPHGFVVKGINVTPAGMVPSAGEFPEGGGGQPPMPPSGVMPGRGGLPTVLNEQLLRITLEVVIVKPLLKK